MAEYQTNSSNQVDSIRKPKYITDPAGERVMSFLGAAFLIISILDTIICIVAAIYLFDEVGNEYGFAALFMAIVLIANGLIIWACFSVFTNISRSLYNIHDLLLSWSPNHEVKTITCKECGTKMPEGVSECPNCGCPTSMMNKKD